jgi:hypothetical protein
LAKRKNVILLKVPLIHIDTHEYNLQLNKNMNKNDKLSSNIHPNTNPQIKSFSYEQIMEIKEKSKKEINEIENKNYFPKNIKLDLIIEKIKNKSYWRNIFTKR